MADDHWLSDDSYAEIDSDGVHVESKAPTDETRWVNLDWSEFDELIDWLGYVRAEEYRRNKEQFRAIGEALVSAVNPDPDAMGPDEVHATEMDVLSGERVGDVVVGRTEDDETFVGVVERGNTPTDRTHSGPGSTMYVAPIDVVGGSIDDDRIAIEGTHVHEPQTRHYPGYDAVEDVGVRVDGAIRRLEYLEVVE